jgi:hypothetical protein
MKNKILLTTLISTLAVSAVHAQFFTAGDLVVLQEGNGSAALTSAGTPIFLDQYTTSGTFLDFTAIPSSGSSSLVNSGTAASEGSLTLSANGQYLVFAGYNAPAGTASIAGTASSADPRGVATVDANGNYTLATTTSSFYSANNIRSGTTDGSGNFWAAGATSGQMYLGTGPAANVSTNVPNSRVIQDIGGNLYYSTGSGSRGVYEISGTPTSASAIANLLIPSGTLGTNASPYDFAFNSGMTIAYVADSTEFTNSTTYGGVEKWTNGISGWGFAYSLSLGTNGAFGLAVDFSGANPIIYATSANGTNLFDIVDTGSTATGTLLATANANEAFRGLDFAPQAAPEPSTFALAGCGLAALVGFRRLKNRRS